LVAEILCGKRHGRRVEARERWRRRRSTGSIEAKAMPNSGYGNSTAIVNSTVMWNTQADPIQAARPRRPSTSNGAPSSTSTVSHADAQQQGMAHHEPSQRRERITEQALAQIVVGHEARQPVAIQPVEAATEAELRQAGHHVGADGHQRHHPQRPAGRRRRAAARRRRGQHQQVQCRQVLGVQDLPPRSAERGEGEEADGEERSADGPPTPTEGHHTGPERRQHQGRHGGG